MQCAKLFFWSIAPIMAFVSDTILSAPTVIQAPEDKVVALKWSEDESILTCQTERVASDFEYYDDPSYETDEHFFCAHTGKQLSTEKLPAISFTNPTTPLRAEVNFHQSLEDITNHIQGALEIYENQTKVNTILLPFLPGTLAPHPTERLIAFTGLGESQKIFFALPESTKIVDMTIALENPITSLAWSPDGTRLAVWDADGDIEVVDPHTSQTYATLYQKPFGLFTKQMAWLPGRKLCINDDILVTGESNNLCFWSLNNQQMISYTEISAAITQMSLSPSGQKIAIKTPATILIFDTSDFVRCPAATPLTNFLYKRELRGSAYCSFQDHDHPYEISFQEDGIAIEQKPFPVPEPLLPLPDVSVFNAADDEAEHPLASN